MFGGWLVASTVLAWTDDNMVVGATAAEMHSHLSVLFGFLVVSTPVYIFGRGILSNEDKRTKRKESRKRRKIEWRLQSHAGSDRSSVGIAGYSEFTEED
jgi:hypothetical protein